VSSSKKQIILIALAVLLVVLFLFMPEQPGSSPSKNEANVAARTVSQANATDSKESITERVSRAIKLVQGEDPMAGIQELLELTREDSTLVDPQYYLGLFSIKSSQFDKGVNRFEKVITFAGLKKYPDTRLLLAECLENLGKRTEALAQLETLILETPAEEKELILSAQDYIERLKN